ncbi:MAG: hypothetical protein FJX72_05735 [Armatimonadetes bacterium]|nr:hypothetical protein [Armatimonadota bacterium]
MSHTPEARRIVVDTGPILALLACGHLEALRLLYEDVVVPLEIREELAAGGRTGFGLEEFEQAHCLACSARATEPTTLLSSMLDRGEAAVVQTALDRGIETVCIDEAAGRRVARL